MIALADYQAPGPTSVALGFFDGVHLGHQALLREAEVAFTFDNHPSTVLRPEAAPPLLTTLAERAALMEGLGKTVVHRPFDREFSQLSPADFAEQVLRHRLQARRVVVGPNYRFGHKASGKPEDLRQLGFEVVEVAPVEKNGEIVSSTAIRQLVGQGRCSEASQWLGHPYSWHQRVVMGHQRGRLLDTPTANLPVPERKVVPAFGVYLVQLQLDGQSYNGVANLGVRPTFENGQQAPLLEVHLLGFEGDLYDRWLTVQFVGRLREERKFDGLESLKAQIARDREQALQFFGG